jgi:predicted RNase H-like HicB family nuclease
MSGIIVKDTQMEVNAEEYISLALKNANTGEHETGGFYGYILGIPGIVALTPSHEETMAKLESMLREWLSNQIMLELPVPKLLIQTEVELKMPNVTETKLEQQISSTSEARQQLTDFDEEDVEMIDLSKIKLLGYIDVFGHLAFCEKFPDGPGSRELNDMLLELANQCHHYSTWHFKPGLYEIGFTTIAYGPNPECDVVLETNSLTFIEDLARGRK